jgi:hypothetical protein
LTGYLHPRALHQSAVDGVSQFDRTEATTRVHVNDRRETGVQVALSALDHDHRAVFDRLVREILAGVHMRVDHAGQNRRSAQVDRPRVGRNLERDADVGDPIAPNEHDLVPQHRARLRVEQAAGANGNNRIRLGPPLGPYDACGEANYSENDAGEPSALAAHEMPHSTEPRTPVPAKKRPSGLQGRAP